MSSNQASFELIHCRALFVINHVRIQMGGLRGGLAQLGRYDRFAVGR